MVIYLIQLGRYHYQQRYAVTVQWNSLLSYNNNPCLEDICVLCEMFCISWYFTTVDKLHSHVGNDIPLHKLNGFVLHF